MRTSLVIMAAGIGSRYGGGIKQLASSGPSGEILMDYSIYDAALAGFDKIVFVIRRDIEKDFKEIIGSRIEKVIDVEYVFQELSDLPDGFSLPQGRTKPWGTGQAILACKNAVCEPFAVINADDFYGREAFCNIHEYLVKNSGKISGGREKVCLSGYVLGNTLSENGGVTRGICESDAHGFLVSLKETKNIRRENGRITADGAGNISEKALVSMNMWGLYPSFIEKLEKGFSEFLGGIAKDDLKSEFLLPIYIDSLIKKGEASAAVLPTDEKWFGLTYKEDLPSVKSAVASLVDGGVYPPNITEALKNLK